VTAAAAGAGLQPLHRQPLFLRFWSAQAVSVFGDQVSALAIPLTAVLLLHASAFEVGLLTAMAWLPHLLFSLPAGVWIDTRPHRRRLMIASDLLRAAALGTLPVAWWLGGLTVWQLLAVTFVVGGLTVVFDLANASFFVALVSRAQYVEAQSRLSTSRSVSYIAGPSVAGFLVQALGARIVGAYRFVNYGTRPVGALLGGVLGSAIGLRETMWISVAGSTAGVLFLFVSPMPQVLEEQLT
jgi:MFS family permease